MDYSFLGCVGIEGLDRIASIFFSHGSHSKKKLLLVRLFCRQKYTFKIWTSNLSCDVCMCLRARQYRWIPRTDCIPCVLLSEDGFVCYDPTLLKKKLTLMLKVTMISSQHYAAVDARKALLFISIVKARKGDWNRDNSPQGLSWASAPSTRLSFSLHWVEGKGVSCQGGVQNSGSVHFVPFPALSSRQWSSLTYLSDTTELPPPNYISHESY